MEDSDEQNSSNSDTKSITASYVNESGASGLENEGFVLQNNSKDNQKKRKSSKEDSYTIENFKNDHEKSKNSKKNKEPIDFSYSQGPSKQKAKLLIEENNS